FQTVAVDVAGNQATSIPVTGRLVDNTPPTATMNDPSTAGGFVRGTIHLTSVTDDPNGTDGSGVASVTYEYSTNGGSTWANTGATLNTASMPDGNLMLHVIVTDHAGNTTTSAPVGDTIDNTKPVTTDDAPSGWQASDVTVHLTATDAGSGVNVTEYSVDGGPYTVGSTTWTTIGTDTTGPAPYTVNWATTAVPDGHYDLQILVTDNANNTTATTLADKIVDNTPPNVAVVGSPTQGAVVSGNLGITASAA